MTFFVTLSFVFCVLSFGFCLLCCLFYLTWQEMKMEKRKYNNAKDVSIFDAGVITK